MNNRSVPIDIEGTMLLPAVTGRTIVDNYLVKQRVEEEVVRDYLVDLCYEFVEKLGKRDYEGLEDFVEPRFLQ